MKSVCPAWDKSHALRSVFILPIVFEPGRDALQRGRRRPEGAPRVPSRPPIQTRLGACGEAALRERPPAT